MSTKDNEVRILHLLITAPDKRVLSILLRDNPLDLSCGGAKRGKDGTVITVEAFVPEEQVDRLRKYGVKVDVLDDATATARERQKEVGKGNRFLGENKVPRGLGRKVKG
jgi:hypothetical protein